MFAGAGRGQRVSVGAAAAAFLVFTALAVFGGAAAEGGVWLQPRSAKESGHFWTPGRMRAAKPIELNPSRRAAGEAAEAEFGANFEQVADPTAPEFRVHGVLFVSLGFFGTGRCSGTAVASRNESVVITAGHCVSTGGLPSRWFRERMVFVPAYRYGQRPFGVFPARWIDTTRQWRGIFGSENFDVGALVVGRNERGQTLGDAVGGVGIAWNLKATQTFDVHGYPAAEPFDGETQRVCRDTPFLGHDPVSFATPGPLNLAVACDTTGGASGGGWLNAAGKLNGVTSYGYFDRESPTFGPYFGREVARLFRRAERVR